MSGWLFLDVGGGRYHLAERGESIIIVPLCGAPLPDDAIEAVSSTHPPGATHRCRPCAVVAGLASARAPEPRPAPERARCASCPRMVGLGVRYCPHCARRRARRQSEGVA